MKKAKIFLLVVGLLYASQCTFAQVEVKTPAAFITYGQALIWIQSTYFQSVDEVDTSGSTWIRGLTYYQVDSYKGYMILYTDYKGYIFRDVPLYIWEGFKTADSFGTYYHSYIKDNYTLKAIFKIN